MNWLRLEHRMREALRAHKKDEAEGIDNRLATLYLIDAILGDETERGYELEDMVSLEHFDPDRKASQDELEVDRQAQARAESMGSGIW